SLDRFCVLIDSTGPADDLVVKTGPKEEPMESFTKLFGSLLVFVYHCFDRIVINGYLEHLARPGQVVHFFRDILGIRLITKEVLGKRTQEYNQWVAAFAGKQKIPMQWAEKGVRKEDFVRHHLNKME